MHPTFDVFAADLRSQGFDEVVEVTWPPLTVLVWLGAIARSTLRQGAPLNSTPPSRTPNAMAIRARPTGSAAAPSLKRVTERTRKRAVRQYPPTHPCQRRFAAQIKDPA